MIEYYKGLYGLGLLLRVHGSPLYKAAIPGAVAAAIYLIIVYRWIREEDAGAFNHPYAVGVLVTSVSFLIVFRANNAYQRYWEACGAVHHMMSKWLDAVTHTGIYHLQCSHYDHIKPPSYFDNPDLNRLSLTREREPPEDWSSEQREQVAILRRRRRVDRSIEYVHSDRKREKAVTAQKLIRMDQGEQNTAHIEWKRSRLAGPGRSDGGWGGLFDDGKATHYTCGSDSDTEEGSVFPSPPVGFESNRGGRTHVLFLQELAHLASLCVAVAFATLRNDIEGSESPLGVYEPGEVWPEPDPDKLPRDVRELMGYKSGPVKLLKYWCGISRSIGARARHNASRPMPVIGGVSEQEIAFLQKARGPSAKVQLAWSWLSEFIIREQLAGTLGAVGPPIISRIFQFLSDGMIFYNHARKIMFIPFPFPSAQLSAFFVLIMVPTIPLLMGQYTNEPWLGAALTFLTVTCLVGLHEVARELENPFRNMPNELPVVTLLAMFNESLITMYSGYHPDHFWDPDVYNKDKELNGEPVPATPETAKEGVEVELETSEQLRISRSMLEALQDQLEKQNKEIQQLRGMLGSNASSVPVNCEEK
eukprot:CAMPEP_0183302134 /NCGR_PEP_ID=MMETSP0160_2-20130417/8027_1 /TAXON_ID=2839 ORGANISM="Odontella Sinensis, Strain Grunow 1884" /NCGR_SAMPLE_ID=MMETSP0160_2 /ASSEMBLY_ACC=CAM_ASM_000250 /LENGTH=588 /DNA_ID=CAMNT_0025464865 /DNA_START=62 /DNA_END=1828 /DNA_ORIENTATION=-